MNTYFQCVCLYALAYLFSGSEAVYIKDIRLASGDGKFQGRVEINIDGVWGTVCDTSFDMADAVVMCRMMNLTATAFYPGAHFGEGVGPIFAREFQCTGSESHLQDCLFVPNELICSHASDVSITCTECGEMSISNGEIAWVFANGTTMKARCDTEYESVTYISHCDSNKQWTPVVCTPIGYPLNITDMRLANGTGLYDGRLEVLVNGTWGTVCSSSFNSSDAIAICRILGHRWAYSYGTTSDYYGVGTGPIYITDLDCPYLATNFSECTYKVENSCTHNSDVAVICYKILLDIIDIRLNGTGPYDGRVELMVDGVWGTVCSKYVGIEEAGTLCNMINSSYSLGRYYQSTELVEDSAPVLIGQIGCSRVKDHVNDCFYYTYSPDCSRSQALSLVCLPCSLDFIHGSVTAANGTNITITCDDGYEPEETYVECFENGSVSYDEVCLIKYSYPLNISDFRMVERRFEIMVEGEWGTICYDDSFDAEAAKIICKMFGLSFIDYYPGDGNGPFFMHTLRCNGLESHISDCNYEVLNSCTDDAAVSIECTAYPLNITGIRLNSTASSQQGRVEVKVGDVWGTVCQDSFDMRDAEVICRMLGLNVPISQVQFYTYARFGPGDGEIYVDELQCNGFENHINECTYLPEHNCRHNLDVSVSCIGNIIYGNQLNITDIRLNGTISSRQGRVEVKVGDLWGTVCDDGFNSAEALVICRMLGFNVSDSSTVQYFSNAHFGPGEGDIYLGDLDCSGDEYHINYCIYRPDAFCTHSEDVSVSCLENHNVTDARLVNGTGPNGGRAEIKVNGSWGTICDHNFDVLQAGAFCDILGKRAAQYLTGARYGQGSGRMYDILCLGSDISSCQFEVTDRCTHERDVSVICSDCGEPDISHWGVDFYTYNGSAFNADCLYYKTYVGALTLTCNNDTNQWIKDGECIEYSYPLAIIDIRLVGGESKSSGRVELKSMDTWGTICDHSFGINEADVICSMIGFAGVSAFYPGAHFGEGSGPIFIDDLSCEDNATDINDCYYVTYDNCSHSNDVSVVCTDCANAIPSNGYSNSTLANEGDVIQIFCKDNYTLLGDSVITCQNGAWSGQPTCKLVCKPWTFGVGCESNCTCDVSNSVSCDAETGQCECKTGWSGSSCAADVDECMNISSCPSNSTCTNYNGTYECSCYSGYYKTKDLQCNVCQDGSYGKNCSEICTCHAKNTETCHRVNGTCFCKLGWEDEKCSSDIDECQNDQNCEDIPESTCNNTFGSFTCVCNAGYREQNNTCEVCANGTFGYNCSRECKCNQLNTESCNHVTGNCSCNKGWTGQTCSDDVDECQKNNTICDVKHNSTCNNTIGSFICSCNDGFLELQNQTCSDIDECKDGSGDCLQSCENTIGGYVCTCLPGYKGSGNNCTDIDECIKSPCAQSCTNTGGSFFCFCQDGYQLQPDNATCDVCDGTHFGSNCLEECKCNFTNTISCDSLTGHCLCVEGWMGANCSLDINECTVGADPCKAKLNSSCVNTDGLFECPCNEGYKEINNTCIDINECDQSDHGCLQECINTDGSYSCTCRVGFRGTGNDCTAMSTTTKQPETPILIEGVVKIETELPPRTNLNAASVYISFEIKLLVTLRAYFRRFTVAVLEIAITNIRPGSIIANFVVRYGTADENVASKLVGAIVELGNGTELVYDGQTVIATSDSYKGTEPCDILYEIFGNCGEGYICNVENNIPVCSLQEKQSEVNMSFVFGLSAVGLFILIAAAVLVVLVRRVQREWKKKTYSAPRDAHMPIRTRYDDLASDYYRSYQWKDGKVVDAGTRLSSAKFIVPRFTTPVRLGGFNEPYNVMPAKPKASQRDARGNWF